MNIEERKPLKLDSSKNKIWFVSDTHFGHQNIIKFCNRPWKTTEEMDEALINNWNSVVGKDDLVFHLGDFAFAQNARWKELISRLNGHITLILGNHDESRWPGDKIMGLFDRVEQQMLLKIDGYQVYLNHYPFLCYAGTYRNPEVATIQLFGHVHSGSNSAGKDSDRLNYRFPYQYDVGVDNNNYFPISWEQVRERIQEQVNNGIAPSKEEHTIPDEVYGE